jgi:hypothetical protein
MATLVVRNPEVYKGRMETTTLLIKNGSSWKAGQFLRAATGTGLTACGDNHTTGTGGPIYYALTDQADPGDTTTTAKVGVVTNDIVFLANEYDTTATNANIGAHAALAVGSNLCTVDISDGASYPFFQIVAAQSDIDPRYDPADTLAKVQVRVLQEIIDDDDQA